MKPPLLNQKKTLVLQTASFIIPYLSIFTVYCILNIGWEL